MPLYSPQSITGKALGGGDPCSCRERCDGAGSSSFSGLLQPVIHGVEDLSVLAAGDRSFRVELLSQQDSFQDGDSCFGSSFSPPGRLDGLSRPQGGLLAGSHPSGQPQVPEVRGLQQGVPILRALLRPLHRSTGLHQGYGSYILNSPQSRCSYPSLSRRLAHPGFVSGGCPPLSGGGPLPLSGVGHSSQSGEVQLCSGSVNPVSGHYSGLFVSYRASPSSQRVEKLLSITNEFLSSRLQPASTW